jgi:hypothetical protein
MEGEGQPVPERRAAPRHSSSVRLTCYPVNSGLSERRQARIRNLSRTGVGLAVDRSWHGGTVLIVELPFEGEIRAVRARVIHATPLLAGTFLVGCNFEVQLTDAEVEALTRE